MTHPESTKNNNSGHHFLFHIFRMDKEENPMPQLKAETLLNQIKLIFKTNSNIDNRRN